MRQQRAKMDIYIYRGDTYEEFLQFFRDEESTIPIDISDATITGTARLGPNDFKWFDLPITVTNAKQGLFMIKMDSEFTTKLGKVGETHTGRFDIQIVRIGKVFTFATGNCIVTDDYTYEE